jgi:hypothetical protein
MSVSVIGTDYDNVDGLAKSLAVHAKASRENGEAILNLADAAKARAEGRRDGPKQSDPRPAYVFQEFPKHVYHADGRDKAVANARALKAAQAAGFRELPYVVVKATPADPAVEKAQLQAKLAESDGKVATLNDALAKIQERLEGLEKASDPDRRTTGRLVTG